MRLYIILVISILISSEINAQDSVLRFELPGKIVPLKQQSNMDCWITVATMMLSWRDGINYSVDSLAHKLGDPWKLYYELDTGLPAKEQNNFINLLGLRSEPPANYLLSAYLDMLKTFGPLWIITGDEFGAHARLLYGIEGNRSYDNSSFLFIDPLKGIMSKQNSLAFFKEFEEEARVANREEKAKKGSWPELRIQIFHF